MAGPGSLGVGPGPATLQMVAPAKLTLSLRVGERRPDGLHGLRSEMVSLSLADELVIDPSGDRLTVEQPAGRPDGAVPEGSDNLVVRALAATGRSAGVRLVKRIPVGGGLGGGSSDAAAVLRWAGRREPALALALGSDVPFCVVGGRAMVSGVGEDVTPLPFVPRDFVLLVPPFGMDTGAVYRAYDEGAGPGSRRALPEWMAAPPDGRPGTAGRGPGLGPNELAGAALRVDGRLGRWGRLLAEVTGRPVMLAGSGSTWFVEGEAARLGVRAPRALGPAGDHGDHGTLLAVRTVPAGWSGDDPPGPGQDRLRR